MLRHRLTRADAHSTLSPCPTKCRSIDLPFQFACMSRHDALRPWPFGFVVYIYLFARRDILEQDPSIIMDAPSLFPFLVHAVHNLHALYLSSCLALKPLASPLLPCYNVCALV